MRGADEPFSPAVTRAFFDGLLPEGFTRRSVASQLHVEESDYLAILSALGRECIGAIRIVIDDETTVHADCRKSWHRSA